VSNKTTRSKSAAKTSKSPAKSRAAKTRALASKAKEAKVSSRMKSKSTKNAAKTAAKKPASKAAAKKPIAKSSPAKTATKPASKVATVKVIAAKVAAVKAAPAKTAKNPPVKTTPAPAPVKPVAAKAVPVAPKVEEVKKVATQRQGFKTNEFVVYPAHGVGQILAIEEQEIAGAKLELFVINFSKDKMTLRVPTAKIVNVGMRKLSDPALVKRALETLKGRARVKRTMWSRRAQEYEAKINSGDIVAIAEVVRDLYRSESQPEQSYSERQLYEAALDRLSREIAAVQHITDTEAVKEIEAALAKSPRRGAKTETAEGDVDADADADSADVDDDDAVAEDEAA
jgi:CarD family transcriptional regulator